jgi:ketosteroid isomerase-like protein
MRSLRLATILVLSAGCSSQKNQTAELSEADKNAIRAVDSVYVAAWLGDDTTGVMATLEPNAIMMPAGQHPMIGDEIRQFWWPNDGSHTKILTFLRHIDELDGKGDIAWTRGTDSLTFSYSKDGTATKMGNRSMTFAVLRRQASGEWRISRMMWANRN